MVSTGIGLVVTLTTISMTILFVLILRMGVAGSFLGNCVGSAIGIVLSWWYLRTCFGFYLRLNKLKQMLSFSLPLVPSSIGVFVALYVDRIAIKQLMTMADVGLYGIGYRISSIATLLMFGLQSALLPILYSQYKEKETPGKIASIFRMFIFGALLMFVILTTFAKELLVLFTTPKYYAASTVVILLLPAVLLSQMYIFAPGLGLAKKTKAMAVINIVVAVANTILNFSLIPFLGIEGAALATLLSNLGGFLANIILGNKHYYIPFEWNKMMLATGIAVPVAILGIALPSSNPAFDYLVKSLICVIFGSILGIILIKKSEIASAFSTIGKLKRA